MSAALPKAAEFCAPQCIPHVPEADIRCSAAITSLCDHLVRSHQQDRRHGQIERAGGFEVKHRFVLDRRLDRQIGWFVAAKNTIDISRRLSIRVGDISPVGEQAAVLNESAIAVNRWQ